jgi:hypothetical protein
MLGAAITKTALHARKVAASNSSVLLFCGASAAGPAVSLRFGVACLPRASPVPPASCTPQGVACSPGTTTQAAPWLAEGP